MLEKQVEAYLRQRIKGFGGLCLKFVSPGTSGVPDRICLLPNGQVMFIEVKREGGKVSDVQKIMIERLRALGHDVRIVWNKEDIDEIYPS